MVNQQPSEPFYPHWGYYDIVKVWRTIQGEGVLTGSPAIFVRFAGCSLECPFCDTDYTTGRHRICTVDLVERIKNELPPNIEPEASLVVLTGGEPFRQELNPLLLELVEEEGFRVQIETNGTLGIDECNESSRIYHNENVMIVCCPKTSGIHQSIPVTYFKYIVDADNICEIDGLPTRSLGMSGKPARPPEGTPPMDIFVQPMEDVDSEKTAKNIQAAVRVCFEFGYRLSLQTHKILGLE